MRTLDRYLLREMLGPFLVALLGFVVLLVGHFLYVAIASILENGVPAGLVLRFVLLQIPTAAVMAFPVSAMLAAALTFNRMVRDNEVPSLRTGGVSLYRLLWPVFLGGLVVTLASFVLLPHSLAPVLWHPVPWHARRSAVVRFRRPKPTTLLQPWWRPANAEATLSRWEPI